MDYVIGVLIGVVIGGVGGYFLRGRHSNATWLTPVLSVGGTLIASLAATIFGKPGYGWKEAALQVVLALVGVGVGAALASRSRSSAA